MNILTTKSKWIIMQLWNFNFMKFVMGKVFSSSTLPNTIKIVSFIGFKYSNNCVAKMTFEAKYPHNLVIRLQSGIRCRAMWLLLFIVRLKKSLLINNARINKPTTKAPSTNFGLRWQNFALRITK